MKGYMKVSHAIRMLKGVERGYAIVRCLACSRVYAMPSSQLAACIEPPSGPGYELPCGCLSDAVGLEIRSVISCPASVPRGAIDPEHGHIFTQFLTDLPLGDPPTAAVSINRLKPLATVNEAAMLANQVFSRRGPRLAAPTYPNEIGDLLRDLRQSRRDFVELQALFTYMYNSTHVLYGDHRATPDQIQPGDVISMKTIEHLTRWLRENSIRPVHKGKYFVAMPETCRRQISEDVLYREYAVRNFSLVVQYEGYFATVRNAALFSVPDYKILGGPVPQALVIAFGRGEITDWPIAHAHPRRPPDYKIKDGEAFWEYDETFVKLGSETSIVTALVGADFPREEQRPETEAGGDSHERDPRISND